MEIADRPPQSSAHRWGPCLFLLSDHFRTNGNLKCSRISGNHAKEAEFMIWTTTSRASAIMRVTPYSPKGSTGRQASAQRIRMRFPPTEFLVRRGLEAEARTGNASPVFREHGRQPFLPTPDSDSGGGFKNRAAWPRSSARPSAENRVFSAPAFRKRRASQPISIRSSFAPNPAPHHPRTRQIKIQPVVRTLGAQF